MPCRAKKRCSVEIATDTPAWPNSRRSSSSVMSRRDPYNARTVFRCASIRCDRVSPPCGLAAYAPVLRRWSCQRITVAASTPNRRAAARQLIPSSTPANARDLKSIDNGLPIHAGLHPASTLNQITAPVGIPLRLVAGGNRSKGLRRVATRYDRRPTVFFFAVAFAATVIFWLWPPKHQRLLHVAIVQRVIGDERPDRHPSTYLHTASTPDRSAARCA